MTDSKPSLTDRDKWVLGALTLISLALILGAILRDDSLYLGYLAGTAGLAVAYMIFFRD